MAQVQNARSSALLRSTRRPFRSIAVTSCSVKERRRRSGLGPLRHCSSATTKVESASADVAAASRCSARRNCAASELISWGSTGDRARVRAFISAICRRRRRGARTRSSRLPIGLGATHGAQRAGSSCAQAAKSR